MRIECILLVSLMSLCSFGCKQGGGGCAQDKLSEFAQLASEASDENRATIAVMVAAEACTRPKALSELALEYAESPRDQRAVQLARFVEGHEEQWERACPGGTQLLHELGEMDASKRDAAFFDGCQLAKLGLSAKPPERKLAKTAMMGVLYAEVFRAAKVPDALSKPLVSAMLFEP